MKRKFIFRSVIGICAITSTSATADEAKLNAFLDKLCFERHDDVTARGQMPKDDWRWHNGHLGNNKDKITGGFFEGKILPNIGVPSGSAPYFMVDPTQDLPKPIATFLQNFSGGHLGGTTKG